MSNSDILPLFDCFTEKVCEESDLMLLDLLMLSLLRSYKRSILNNLHGYSKKEVQEWYNMYKMCRFYLSSNRDKNKDLLSLIHEFMRLFEIIRPESQNDSEWLHDKIGSVPPQNQIPRIPRPRAAKTERSSVANAAKSQRSSVAKHETVSAEHTTSGNNDWLYKIIGSAPSQDRLPRVPLPRAVKKIKKV